MPPSALRPRRCTASETTIIHFVSTQPRPPSPDDTAMRPPAQGTLSVANTWSDSGLCKPRARLCSAAPELTRLQDCFYASVFENESPHLKTLPLAVQQKQIVVTCNYVARERVSFLVVSATLYEYTCSSHDSPAKPADLRAAGTEKAPADHRCKKTLSGRRNRTGRGPDTLQKCFQRAILVAEILLVECAV
jgi:hypothetical protein